MIAEPQRSAPANSAYHSQSPNPRWVMGVLALPSSCRPTCTASARRCSAPVAGPPRLRRARALLSRSSFERPTTRPQRQCLLADFSSFQWPLPACSDVASVRVRPSGPSARALGYPDMLCTISLTLSQVTSPEFPYLLLLLVCQASQSEIHDDEATRAVRQFCDEVFLPSCAVRPSRKRRTGHSCSAPRSMRRAAACTA